MTTSSMSKESNSAPSPAQWTEIHPGRPLLPSQPPLTFPPPPSPPPPGADPPLALFVSASRDASGDAGVPGAGVVQEEEGEGDDEVAGLQRALRGRGFAMPAEWGRHDGCWMAWPERTDNWHSNAGPAQEAFAEVASAISQFEAVTMLASQKQWERARAMLPASVRVLECSTNDAWMRDMGPTFVVRGAPNSDGRQLAVVDWEFNSWGGLTSGCYSDWSLDALVPAKVCEILGGMERVRTRFVMEGGSFHVDGEGTLLTTEECLLHPNRNPHLTREAIEQRLSACLGVDAFIWLPRGLHGDDDTNGHVDNLACFAAPGTVILSWTDDPEHPQFGVCRDALGALEAAVDAKGRKIRVVKLPLPPPLHYTKEEVDTLSDLEDTGQPARQEGQLLSASYANFYLPNGGLVVPAFGVESDGIARAVLEETFPDRKVVMISRGRTLVLGGGNVHCITQQQPSIK